MNVVVWSGTLTVALLVATTPAAGQIARPERPYRGLFGGGVGAWNQMVAMRASLAGGYHGDIATDALGITGPNVGTRLPVRGGAIGGASTVLSYSLDRGRVGLGASAASATRYYPSLRTKFLTRYSGSVGASLRIMDGLSINGAAQYQPYTLIQVLPTLVPPRIGESDAPDLDLATSREHHVSYSGGAGFSRPVTRRSRFDLTYGYRASELPGQGGEFRNHSGGASFSLGLAQGLNLQLGYGYSVALRPTGHGRSAENHSLIGGINYNKALSFSRRTTLSMSTGSAAVRDGRLIHYRAIGSASLNHELGRTWAAALTYSRNAQFVETWQEPVFSDSLALGFGGLISRRLELQFSARTALGEVGVDAADRGFSAYHGTARLQFAASRYVGMGLDYGYSRYDFDSGVVLPAGWPSTAHHHRVMADVSFWVPVFIQSRRPNVTR